jgi:Na+:H+ antiporter, NhaA family
MPDGTRRPSLGVLARFVRSESAGGFVMIAVALVAFLCANSSPLSPAYFSLRDLRIGAGGLEKPLVLWVNDGLMALFFFLVGLEIKREVLAGRLSSPKDASLAVFAAVGGMVVPAAVYLAINAGGEGVGGWGVPMATDVAFALAVLSLLGSGVPAALKVLLAALAIVDDVGAIVVIAVFYAEGLNPLSLLLSLAVVGAAFAYGALGGRRIPVLAVLGAVAWFFMLRSGVHATIAGVLLAAATPMGGGAERETDDGPLHRLEGGLAPWVAYFILPAFALLNAGVPISGGSGLFTPVALGVALGLLVGMPLGVLGACWLAARLRLASLPEGVGWGAWRAWGCWPGSGSPSPSSSRGSPSPEAAPSSTRPGSAPSRPPRSPPCWVWCCWVGG